MENKQVKKQVRKTKGAKGKIVPLYTKRKEAEKALRESEERYRVVFEQAADSIVLIDGETGALLEFNDRAHENLGYTRDEFRKLKIPDFEIIESAEEVTKHIEKIIREGSDFFETKHRRKDGQIRNIVVSSRAISIGGKDFVQSIWRDITERKRAEEAIEHGKKEWIETDSQNCSVCRDLLSNMQQFFDILQSAQRSLGSDWLTVDNIASELKISKTVVYRLIRNGELEAVNIVATSGHIAQRGHYRIKRSSLNKYLEVKKVKPLPDESVRISRPRRFPKVTNHLGL